MKTGMKICLRPSQPKEEMAECFHRANPVQKNIINEFCQKELEAQVEFLRERFGLEKYDPHLTCNHSTKAAASYGGEMTDGEPFVVLALNSINLRVGDCREFLYDEYEFLRNKPGIGDGIANWKKWTAWLIAHELAHTVVEIKRFREQAEPHLPKDITRDRRDHGKFWQAVYRELRCGFCETREQQGAYNVVMIDFSDYIYHVVERCGGVQNITFYRGEEPIAYYVRDKGTLYKTNRNFRNRRATKRRNVREIKGSLVTV